MLFVILVTINTILSLAIFFGARSMAISNDKVCSRRRVMGTSRVGANSGLFLVGSSGATRGVAAELPCVCGIGVGGRLPTAIGVAITSTDTTCTVRGTSGAFVLTSSGCGILRTTTRRRPTNDVVVAGTIMGDTRPNGRLRFRSRAISGYVARVARTVGSARVGNMATMDDGSVGGGCVICSKHVAFRLNSYSSLRVGVGHNILVYSRVGRAGPDVGKGVGLGSNGRDCFAPRWAVWGVAVSWDRSLCGVGRVSDLFLSFICCTRVDGG